MPLKGKSSTISTYPEKEGFYRVASGTLFQNMTPDSPYGLLIMFGAVYKLHMFISSQGSLYWGYTDNYTEPSKWHEAGDASEFLQLDGGTLTGDLKVEKSFPRLELKDSKSARSLDFLAIDDYVEIVNRLDDTDSRGIRIKPETEDVKTSVFIDEYINGLHKAYQLFGEHNTDLLKNYVKSFTGVETLWENANLSSSFAGQTFSPTFVRDEYVLFFVMFKQGGNDTPNMRVMIPVRPNGYPHEANMFINISLSTYPEIIRRTVTFNPSNTITFGEGLKKVINSSSYNTDNNYMIPVAIYGIKK
jgi:hypothetical protein